VSDNIPLGETAAAACPYFARKLEAMADLGVDSTAEFPIYT